MRIWSPRSFQSGVKRAGVDVGLGVEFSLFLFHLSIVRSHFGDAGSLIIPRSTCNPAVYFVLVHRSVYFYLPVCLPLHVNKLALWVFCSMGFLCKLWLVFSHICI